MKIIFSDHAKAQIVIRKIPKKYILEAIKQPQEKVKSYRNRTLLRKGFGGKILEVVVYREQNASIVITQYYLEENL